MTAARPPRVPVDRLREAARLRAARTSARQVAAEIGRTPTWLLAFLGGAQPRASTMEKLRAWYAAHYGDDAEQAGGPEPLTPAQAATALSVLLLHLPRSLWAAGAREIIGVLEQAAGRAERPRWMDELRQNPPGEPPA